MLCLELLERFVFYNNIMDQFLSLLCTCVKEVMDKDGDGIPDFMQQGKVTYT